MNKKWRFALIGMLVLWISIKIFNIYLHKTYTKEELDALFDPIASKYGIEIVYKIRDDFFSDLVNPPIPAGPDRQSRIRPIRHRVLITYTDLLRKAFHKYPDHVIRHYLRGIHFAAEIDQAGFKYGGSYDPFRKIIYLVNHGWIPEDEAISTFHHEFSSLLMRSHSFYVNSWTDQHPKDFKYLGELFDSIEATDEARERYTDSECYEIGIITNYGLTGFGNDFSDYSAMIFTYPKKFKALMNQYPRIRGKFLVWLEFYQKIDPIFTEAYLLGNN